MLRTIRYAALILTLLAILFGAAFLYPPRPVLALLADLNPGVLFYVETERPVVALTFDDGPHADLTPRILDLLDEHDAKATFFLIGDRIEGNEDLLDRMNVSGHELANHLGSDSPSFMLSAADFEAQLVCVDSLLSAASDAKWFRPGSGWYHPRMLRQLEEHGYRLSLGSYYPIDPYLKNSHLVAEQVLGHIHSGAILILHEGSEERLLTLEVLERILPEIKSRGFEIVTLSELASLETERI